MNRSPWDVTVAGRARIARGWSFPCMKRENAQVGRWGTLVHIMLPVGFLLFSSSFFLLSFSSHFFFFPLSLIFLLPFSLVLFLWSFLLLCFLGGCVGLPVLSPSFFKFHCSYFFFWNFIVSDNCSFLWTTPSDWFSGPDSLTFCLAISGVDELQRIRAAMMKDGCSDRDIALVEAIRENLKFRQNKRIGKCPNRNV